MFGGQLRRTASSYVLRGSDRFKVLGVDTRRHSAQVVDLQALWNRPLDTLVLEAMCIRVTASTIGHLPVALGGTSEAPNPAGTMEARFRHHVRQLKRCPAATPAPALSSVTAARSVCRQR